MRITAPIPDAPLASDPASLRASIVHHLAHSQIRDQYRATALDVLGAVSRAVRDRVADRWLECSKSQWDAGHKRVYYLSMEYLPGRLLRDALWNLGIYAPTADACASLGVDLAEVIEVEPDPGLGNGGLGRLASCFLDSMASLGIAGTGYGIRYDYGIFKQAIAGGQQVEEPDSWLLHGTPWAFERTETTYRVRYGGSVHAVGDAQGTYFRLEGTDDVLAEAHDVPVVGYRNDVVNTLRLWWPRPVVEFDLALFNHGDHAGSVAARNTAQHISRVLYPNDAGPAGKELRLRQEFFFVSASLQDAITRHRARWGTLDDLPERNVFQLNDTHPALAVAEMMRILLDEHRFTWERAWAITRRSFAYTNHTLLPEALETWPVHMLDRLLPRQLDIIQEIDRRFTTEITLQTKGDEEKLKRMAIVERGPQPSVRMAHLSIVGGFSVNGVSALHSQLLREQMFPDFDRFYPGRFRNETNGVTPRRWIQQCNFGLASILDEVSGPTWPTHLELLQKLEPLADDAAFRARWRAIKHANKEALQKHLRTLDIEVDPSSLFDIQIKRIHEYKRQLLCLLHAVARWQALKAGQKLAPRTILIGGKAASAYDMAKRIIHLANSIAAVVNADPETRDRLRVHFVPNYRVSLAEKLIPAADLSEQISTAGQEASGTGNMKLSMNGALTIGTLDGANVEIRDAVGAENFFLFGMTVEEVRALEASGTYAPKDVAAADPRLGAVLDAIAGGTFSPDEPGRFRPIVDSLLGRDRFLLLADFASYLDAQARVDAAWADPENWTRMSILNTARMGRFSSDATIRDYARQIWGVPTG